MCVGAWGRRENHLGETLGGLGDWSLRLLVLSVLFSKCLRHQKQLLLEPTAQGFLTDKMQMIKTPREPSALVKDLLGAVIVVGFEKKDDGASLRVRRCVR